MSQPAPVVATRVHPGPDRVQRASSSSQSDAESPRVTVLVVDNHPGFRGALEALIRSAGDLVLLGSACDGEEAVVLSARLRPRVVVMDLAMPGVDGVEATRRLLGQRLPPVVVALSGSHELIRDAVSAGAAFTVLKDVDPDRLLGLIRAAGS
jgi:DNA-binding NarL/FixJ family response regulator